MAARKTYKFLPGVFQTDTNKKFLSATIDQLISEPDLVRLYGYIGRKFSPTYKLGDSYVTESSRDRQDCQLEPSVNVKDQQDNIIFLNNYIDYLNKIKYYGGFTQNHDRLFDSEYYTFDPLVSFDKLVNFSQYYWLPDGPDSVDVNSSGISLIKTYTVTRNGNTGRYEFFSNGKRVSTLTLARGGTYTFEVDQPGYPFWIQSELGVDGLLNATPTISSRNVLGVENNGTDSGEVVFKVPQTDAQDRFVQMDTVFNADYATPITYSDLHNLTLSQFLDLYPQYAGITGQLDGKYTIFVGQQNMSNVSEEIWTARTVKDPDGNDITGWGEGEVVADAQRFGVWKVQFIYNVSGLGDDPLIRLVFEQAVATNEKIYIKYGLANANKEYYKDYDGFFYQMPLLTSLQDKLYIQDGVAPGTSAELKLVDYGNSVINVTEDILGKSNYTSPNGIEFTSGLKITFGSDVTPATYQNKTYYVEQVGDIGTGASAGIRLVDVDLLVTPENYVNEYATNYPNGIEDNTCNAEYITINRGSIDLNAWSRTNRWFHRDVIIATAEYNNTEILLDQNKRARRPIIQFECDLQLYNYGRIGKQAIDILDTSTLDAFSDLDGRVLASAFGIDLVDGLRVIFAADQDALIRDKIYVLNLVQYDFDENNLPTGPFYIKLTIADDGDAEVNDTVVVTKGQYAGSQWWYDGTNWLESQQKTELQQEPLFDVFDLTGKSFSEYTRSTFTGTKLFGYEKNINYDTDGTVISQGAIDKVLQFPLSYRNFTTQGDIEFGNFFNTDEFNYIGQSTEYNEKVSVGFLQKIRGRFTLKPKNTWIKVTENSKQYQLINFVYDGTNNPYELDITPEISDSVPYVKVYINNKYYKTGWSISGRTITISTTLAVNDNIDILVYSKQISKQGHYLVPSNLDLNAQNTDIELLTLGQIRNHLTVLDENSTIVDGDVLGISNLRDVDIKQQGGSILQHSAPVPIGQLFLADESANFVDGLRYAQKEYARFKNRFLELSISLSGIQPLDAPASVDLILTEMNKIKNKTFPWFHSDMVPYNTLRNTITYTVFDTLKTDYEITNIFDDEELSNKAVLIYHNGLQLVKDQDYVFRDDRPAVTINVELSVDDVLEIIEFDNTDGNYIPETPTKLGLYPKFLPRVFEDDTYREPIRVIQGHDGSIIPTFNDYRDDFILELEKRIYNNIKLPPSEVYNQLSSALPGKFRTTDYNLRELNQILGRSFMSWIGGNGLDFSTNSVFQSNDSFTWNYSGLLDRIDDEVLPGSWRSCYLYFYDTVRPHLMPWEMLGFAIKPSWWENYYGPAPYTGGNKLLWDDLEAGRIVEGERAGIDEYYARPGLSQVIPVDENGNLLSPAQILTKAFNTSHAQASWAIGHMGPTEWAWRTSSDYPFALQQALAVMKPAKYFALMANNFSIRYNSDIEQYISNNDRQHIKQHDLGYNGRIINGSIQRKAGYINWISDYLVAQGMNPEDKITYLLENYTVNLAYKVAGFTDQKYLNILAEQNSPSSTNDSIVIPNENYKVHLYKSTPVNKLVYSGVIVEKTANGYTIRGYDLGNPYFTIIPSIVNKNAYKLDVLGKSAVIYRDYQNLKLTVPYGYEFTSAQQIADFLISYERYLQSQGFIFDESDEDLTEIKNFKLSVKEFLYWIQQGWKAGSILVLSPVAEKIKVYTRGVITDAVEDKQYGTKVVDQNFRLVKNNNYNVMRTPSLTVINLTDSDSVIGYIELNLVQYEHVLIFDNSTVFNDIIYKPELGNRQYRLKLIGRKTANWDGSLSAPGFIYNSGYVDTWRAGKDYLKGDLVEYKNQYYTALNNITAADDFDFSKWKLLENGEIKKGLLPNFSTNAVEGIDYYNAYPTVDNKEQTDFSHGLIGYRPRQYLSDLGITENSQIEFYKGFIREKGTANAVNKMLNAKFNNLTTDIDFYEEWAIRIGEYGAIGSNPFVEVALDETVYGVNPSIARFVGTSQNNQGNGVDVFNSSQLYRSTDQFNGNIALNRTDSSNYDNDIPTAGYVNLNDVNTTLFDLENYDELDNRINEVGIGYTIWVAKDFSGDWNVYRVTETDNKVISIKNVLDGYISVETRLPHGLAVDDIFVIKDFDDTAFNGFYRVDRLLDINTVQVTYNGNTDNLLESVGDGMIFKLVSSRFVYMEDCREFGRPPHGWKVGETVWIDDDASTSFAQNQPYAVPYYSWKVYEKAEPYFVKQSLVKSSYASADGYGHSVRMSPDQLLAVVGNPQIGTYRILINQPITANVGDFFTQAAGANLTIISDGESSFTLIGKYNENSTASVNLIGNLSINGVDTGITVDEIVEQTGEVNTFLKDSEDNFSENFTLRPDGDQTTEYGYITELALNSNNDSILAIGAPGSYGNIGYVYLYKKSITSSTYNRYQVITGDVSLADSRFGHGLFLNQTGDWFAVGCPNIDTVYVYGLKRFVPYHQQIESVNNENIVHLNTPITVVAGDLIRQPATGMEALVLNSGTTANIQVSTLTNLNTTITGNIIISNVEVDGSVTINNVDTGAYPETTDSYSVTTEISLTFTPDPNCEDDPNSLLITSRDRTYIPGIDYEFFTANATVAFYDLLVQDDYSIVQQPYYALLDTKTGNVNSQFGYALSWSYDGAQLAVGAPNDTVGVKTNATEIENGKTYTIHSAGTTDFTLLGAANSSVGTTFVANLDLGAGTGTGVAVNQHIGAGSVWVFDRVIEAFKSTGEQDYTTLNPIVDVYKVTIDEVEVNDYLTHLSYDEFGNQYFSNDHLVRFINPPDFGKIVFVETNEFILLEKLIGIDSLEGGLRAIQDNARFGESLTICSNNCAIYIGAPNYDAGTSYNTGAVWKFHNRGRLYGTNTAFAIEPTFNIGDTIRLDNFEVTVTDPGTGVATVDSLVDDINNANLLGISAINDAGRLRIDSDRTVAKNLLRILAGQGSVLADAEMAVFAFMQIIINPFNLGSEYFGTKVKLAPNAYSLVISSGRGTTKQFATFDAHSDWVSPEADDVTQYLLDKDSTLTGLPTTFDDDSTRFLDSLKQSGSVYIYELYDDPRDEVEHPGRYQYAQQLIPNDLDPGDQLGYAVDIENNYVVISSLTDSTNFPQGGSVYIFQTPIGVRGWTLKRYEEDKVDIQSINKLYLYDTQSNVILETLQYIDPAKGKVLGQAEQEITFKTAYDPAMYNRGYNPRVSLNNDIYWNDVQVGKVWWNLDQVRFIDYEQDTLEYRSINWGRLFPGSIVEVCEWVRSDVLPSQHVGAGYDGVPKYPNDSAYVEVTRVDPITNIIVSSYYYWVIDKITVDPLDGTRKLPLRAISDLIENPKTQSIPYAAFIQNDSIILYNVGPYLSATNTILHIGYDTAVNSQIIHSEYELVQKGNPNQYISAKIINKMIDSLAGIDKIGRTVPDPALSLADRYGISYRPRQSAFINRLSAVQELVAYVNSVFRQHPIARQYKLNQMLAEENQPSLKLGEYDQAIATDTYLEYISTDDLPVGYKVLVENHSGEDGLWVLYELSDDKTWDIIRVQSYKTDLYWNYVDWYADGYDANEQIEYVVETLPDALKLPVASGDEILVKVNNYGGVNQGWNLITVLDSGEFQVVGIQNGTIQLKTSLGNFADNNLGFGNQDFASNRFDQNPNEEIRNILYAIKDDIFINELSVEFNKLFFTMINYLFSEQKYVDWIFKTSFISVTHKLRTLSQFPSYIEDNQTYYQDYINEVKPYRTKIREYTINYDGSDEYDGHITDFDLPPYYDTDLKVFRSPSGEEVAKDSALWLTEPYNDWYDHRKFGINRIEVTDPGRGYTSVPIIQILNGPGGGSGATAEAIIDGDTGELLEIIVTNKGSGYVSTPTVIVNGSCEETARAYAYIENNQQRSFDTTIKFDRVNYSTGVREWTANTFYTTGEIITHSILDGDTYVRTAYLVPANVTSGSTFVSDNYQVYSANLFTTANDRIWGYYSPPDDMPARDLNQLVYGVEYPGVQVQGPSFNIQPGFGDSAMVQLTLSGDVSVSAGNIVTQGNANITISNTATSSSVIYGILNSTADFEINGANISINGSSAGVYPTTVEYVNSGTSTPFDSTTFDNFDYEGSEEILGTSSVDTVIRSTYLDTSLGLRPEDINVDGGAYVDTYSSHAPEELVPGIVSDSLHMKVYTKIDGNATVLGYRLFSRQFYLHDTKQQQTEFLRISDSYSTSLAEPLMPTDANVYVIDSSVLPSPGVDDAIPGVVFVGCERITYWGIDYTNHVLYNIRRGTQGTAVADVHPARTSVVDASIQQIVPYSGNIQVETTYANTYTVTNNVTHRLELSGNVAINVGDIITQVTSGTNVTVVGVDSLVTTDIYVLYNGLADFNYLASNVGATSNLAINGTYTGNIFPVASSIVGNTYPYYDATVGYGIDSDGNVTVLAGNVITSNVWYNLGSGTASDGTGFEGTTTYAVQFLKDAPATALSVSSISEALGTEDAINTLTTESGDEIYEEDQE